MMTRVIRAARYDEAVALRDVELASGALFAEIGMDDIADGDVMWLDHWDRLHAEGQVWVDERDGRIVGFAIGERLDGCLHLEQLSVDPAFGRQGIGSALVEHVCAQAAELGLPAVTLSTFADVAFNAPLYARLGFEIIAEPDLTSGLAARRDHETAEGLDPATRVLMRRVTRRGAAGGR